MAVRLSKRTIASLVPRDRTYIAFDAELSGFGLRVMPSGAMTWVVEYRPAGGGRRAAKRRMKIDGANKITPEEARLQARQILARVRLGEDPARTRSLNRRVP